MFTLNQTLLATTDKTDQEKAENVSKQMETTTEQEYTN